MIMNAIPTEPPSAKVAPVSKSWVKLHPPEWRSDAHYPKDGTIAGLRLRALALACKMFDYPEAFHDDAKRKVAKAAIWATLEGNAAAIWDGDCCRSPEQIIDRLLSYWDYNYGEDLTDVVDAYPTGGDETAIRGWAARARDAAMAALDKGAA